ncbi:MAG: cupredoxin domain-containing protein [Myxococcota bacterium]
MKLLRLFLPLAVPLAAISGTALADSAKPAARIEIAVTSEGFAPDNIKVPAKKPVTLVFTRKTDVTCAKSVVVSLGEGKQVERELPLNKPVEIAVTFPKSGTLSYACSMDMVKGVVLVQ